MKLQRRESNSYITKQLQFPSQLCILFIPQVTDVNIFGESMEFVYFC